MESGFDAIERYQFQLDMSKVPCAKLFLFVQSYADHPTSADIFGRKPLIGTFGLIRILCAGTSDTATILRTVS